MTPAQLGHALGSNPNEVSIADIQQKTAASQRRVFDRICKEKNLTPEMLVKQPLDTVEEWITRACGARPPRENLESALKEYSCQTSKKA